MATSEDFLKRFGGWLHESAGVTTNLLDSLMNDDDWTFVVKIHAMIEVGLNHLIIAHLEQPSLNDVVARLETNNPRAGKLAFVKACGLLHEDGILLVRLLSEVRNRAVHGIENFDLNLAGYFRDLDVNQQKNWRRALTWWMTEPLEKSVSLNKEFTQPRELIRVAGMAILATAYQKATLLDRAREMVDEMVEEMVKKRNQPDSEK
jgi:hypothetical protein